MSKQAAIRALRARKREPVIGFIHAEYQALFRQPVVLGLSYHMHEQLMKKRKAKAQPPAINPPETPEQALARYQGEVWLSLDRYSRALGWGLTGNQPECWACLDGAVTELEETREFIKCLRSVLKAEKAPLPHLLLAVRSGVQSPPLLSMERYVIKTVAAAAHLVGACDDPALGETILRRACAMLEKAWSFQYRKLKRETPVYALGAALGTFWNTIGHELTATVCAPLSHFTAYYGEDMNPPGQEGNVSLRFSASNAIQRLVINLKLLPEP